MGCSHGRCTYHTCDQRPMLGAWQLRLLCLLYLSVSRLCPAALMHRQLLHIVYDATTALPCIVTASMVCFCLLTTMGCLRGRCTCRTCSSFVCCQSRPRPAAVPCRKRLLCLPATRRGVFTHHYTSPGFTGLAANSLCCVAICCRSGCLEHLVVLRDGGGAFQRV
jgi:hypothetical protein